MEALLNDAFSEIAVLLVLASAVGFVGLLLRQPLIVSFIAVGILVGPTALGWVDANDLVDLLAKLGIALLLFLVGLKLDLKIIRTMGPVALAAGLGQVAFTSFFGFLISLGLGLEPVPALYVAVALTFSSTIIIVKLLSDKRELDQLHGRIAIGFLIVQDIVVVLVMIALTALGEAEGTDLGREALRVFVNGILFVGVIALLMRFVLTPLLHQLSRSSELLVLFSIAWAVALGALGIELGFSKEVGAFLAGVSIASTPYREIVGARLVSLRDFLLLFFFIDLGVNLDLSSLLDQLIPAVILSLFVLIGNPVIVMIILGWMGYRKRTGFLAGLTVAQISEFSLILAALGLSQGHISESVVGLVTLVGLITISASTYMILYSEFLYEKLSPLLSLFEREIPTREERQAAESEEAYDIVQFGLGRFGSLIAAELSKSGQTVLAIDHMPNTLLVHANKNFDVAFGDIESPDFVEHLPLDKSRCVLSTVRLLPANLALLQTLHDLEYHGAIAIVADSDADAEVLDSHGVTLILRPYRDASIEVSKKLSADIKAYSGSQSS